jgi:hypothetical protein
MNEEQSSEFCPRWKQLNTGDRREIRLLIADVRDKKKIVRGGIAEKAKPAVSGLYLTVYNNITHDERKRKITKLIY